MKLSRRQYITNIPVGYIKTYITIFDIGNHTFYLFPRSEIVREDNYSEAEKRIAEAMFWQK